VRIRRAARLDTPSLLHHVMIREIGRRKIFNDEKDRENFIDRLASLLPETKTQCRTWSFLSSRAHLLFKSGPEGIAVLMRGLLTGYAVYYKENCLNSWPPRYSLQPVCCRLRDVILVGRRVITFVYLRPSVFR
jgi:hypothetical protein